MLKLDGDFSLEAEKRKKPTKSLAAFQLKIIVYVDLTSISFYYHTSLGTSFRISLVFSYRQLDLKSNDEHCNEKNTAEILLMATLLHQPPAKHSRQIKD